MHSDARKKFEKKEKETNGRGRILGLSWYING
jgi:hypothetical protein